MGHGIKTALLVAERESDWDGWLEQLGGESHDVAVILQRAGETPAALATRVRERVQELRASGVLVAAALVGRNAWDDATLAARSLMIRAIVSPMVGSGGGRLYLDAGSRVGRGRHAMQAIASLVEDQVGSTGVDVHVTTAAHPVRKAA